MSLDRAMRRALAERMKRRVRHYYGGWAGDDARTTGRVARTRTLCSCYYVGCGNHRKYRGPTVQERREMERIAYEAQCEQ